MSEPWGHKVTIHVYVPGAMAAANKITRAVIPAVNGSLRSNQLPPVEFVGMDVKAVQDCPVDQVAS